jgi:hypothetical protein
MLAAQFGDIMKMYKKKRKEARRKKNEKKLHPQRQRLTKEKSCSPWSSGSSNTFGIWYHAIDSTATTGGIKRSEQENAPQKGVVVVVVLVGGGKREERKGKKGKSISQKMRRCERSPMLTHTPT